MDAAIESWSRGLGRAAAAAERATVGRFPGEAWKNLFQLERQLCSLAPWNAAWRRRGKVLLSEELLTDPSLRLLVQVPRGERLHHTALAGPDPEVERGETRRDEGADREHPAHPNP